MNTESMYTALGITPAVHRFGEEVLAGLRARFDEIDRMDMLGFLRIRAWKARHDKKKAEPRRAFIDEVWPTVARLNP